MIALLKSWSPQPLVGSLLSGLAVVGIGGAWLLEGAPAVSVSTLLIILVLIVGIVAAYRFPIHVGLRRKVEMSTVPIYLLVVLVPGVGLAATAVGLGILLGELMVRAQRGNYYSDVLTNVSRWVVVVLIGAAVGHIQGGDSAFRLLVVALVLCAGELLTYPLLLAPITGDPPLAVLAGALSDSLPVEAVQYLLGVLGALAVTVQGWVLLLVILPTVLIYFAVKSAKEMRNSTQQMMEHMADIVDLRDPYTGGHSRRVAAYTERILHEMNVTGPEADLIVAAARVHDIGKIGIPDSVLNKPGRLTAEEAAIMQAHPDRGADVLACYPDFARGMTIVRHHHEHWNGGGYPAGLHETAIPFGARVIAVADSYDAMTSDRPYRSAMAADVAARILWEGRGQQWDAAVVDACLRTLSLSGAGDPQPSPQPAPALDGGTLCAPVLPGMVAGVAGPGTLNGPG